MAELKSLLIVSVGLNVILALITSMVLVENLALSDRVSELTGELRSVREALNVTSAQLEYYRSLFRSVEGSGLGPTVASSEVNLVAVRSIPSDYGVSYEGVVLQAKLEVRRGRGDVYVNTHPRVGIDLQSSVRTAVEVAESITKIDLSGFDIVLTVTAEEEVDVVDGPSAGLALTLALTLAFENRSIPSYVYMTGTVDSKGRVGQVGGVLAKALAAAKMGAKIFLVPPGQSVDVVWEVREERSFLFTIRYLVPRQVSVESYLRERGFNVKIVEVPNVEEALKVVSKLA